MIPFSALSASLTSMDSTIKNSKPFPSITWVNILQNLQRMLLEGKDIEGNFNLMIKLNSPLRSLEILNIRNFFELKFGTSMCASFPNLIILMMTNTFMNYFPGDLALHKCSRLREIEMSNIESNINSFNKELNLTLPNLSTLKITQNNVTLTKAIFSIKAPKLKTLDISGNLIKIIGTELIHVFPNLTHLSIMNNAVESLFGLENLKFLQYLNAAGNKITDVPPGLLLSSLKTLDLRNNPFTCSCDIQPFKNWIISNNTTWLLPGEYVCASPKALIGLSVTAIELDCRSYIAFYLGVSIPSALVLCIGIILLIHYRWHIKYKLFLLYRNYYPFPDNNEEDFEMLQLQYHAYVSYNEESRVDDDWVMNNLQSNMEEGPEPQRLFIKSRDFMPGQSLIQGISENIQLSRKTILVLSPHFVESEWCYHEMEMAQMRLLDQNLDVLVLVLLQDIPNDKITLSLRKLLCKKEYLKWPETEQDSDCFGKDCDWNSKHLSKWIVAFIKGIFTDVE